MSVHAVERILEQMQTILLTKDGGGEYQTDANGNVFRRKVRAQDSSTGIPAIDILSGEDKALPYSNTRFIDSTLEVSTEIAVAVVGTDVIDAALNEMRTQVHKLLLADLTLGLPFVFTIMPDGAAKPEVKGLGEKQVCAQELKWKVTYRTPISDPSVN